MIILSINSWSGGFQHNLNAIIPSHLQWIHGNQQPRNQFKYAKTTGPRSSTVIEFTQNANFENKEPSSGSCNYSDVMKKLGKQKNDTISVTDQIYNIKNSYGCNIK